MRFSTMLPTISRRASRAPMPLLVAGGLLVAGLAGCDTGPRPPAGAFQDPVLASNYPNVTVDPGLQKFLVVDYSLIVAQPATEQRPLFVQVPARSQADNEFAIQYNFEFYGSDNRKLGETGYKTAVIPSRRQIMLSGNAITEKAAAWRLDVRSAR